MSTATPFTITPSTDLLRTHPQIKGMADSISSAYEKHLLVEEKHLQAMGQAADTIEMVLARMPKENAAQTPDLSAEQRNVMQHWADFVEAQQVAQSPNAGAGRSRVRS